MAEFFIGSAWSGIFKQRGLLTPDGSYTETPDSWERMTFSWGCPGCKLVNDCECPNYKRVARLREVINRVCPTFYIYGVLH
jgi:hypothetical protein